MLTRDMPSQRYPQHHSLTNLPPELQLLIDDHLDVWSKAAVIESSILPVSLISTNKINDYDSDGYTLLHAAAKQNYTTTVTLLLSCGAHPSPICKTQPGTRDGDATPLVFASENGNIKVIDLLVEHGANVNESSEAGHTCLHEAISNDHEKAVDVLLEYGANPNTKHYFVCSPLSIAAEVSSWIEMDAWKGTGVREMQERVGSSGEKEAYAEILRLLIDAGADVSAVPDRSRISPLHIAAVVGNRAMVKILLTGGVNVNVRTSRGLSAVCLARMLGYADIVETLEKARKTRPDTRRPAIGRKFVS